MSGTRLDILPSPAARARPICSAGGGEGDVSGTVHFSAGKWGKGKPIWTAGKLVYSQLTRSDSSLPERYITVPSDPPRLGPGWEKISAASHLHSEHRNRFPSPRSGEGFWGGWKGGEGGGLKSGEPGGKKSAPLRPPLAYFGPWEAGGKDQRLSHGWENTPSESRNRPPAPKKQPPTPPTHPPVLLSPPTHTHTHRGSKVSGPTGPA